MSSEGGFLFSTTPTDAFEGNCQCSTAGHQERWTSGDRHHKEEGNASGLRSSHVLVSGDVQ